MKLENHDIPTYLGKLDHLIAYFDPFMPLINDAEKYVEQCDKFFMVCALAGLPLEFEFVRTQILSGTFVPLMTLLMNNYFAFLFLTDLVNHMYQTLISLLFSPNLSY